MIIIPSVKFMIIILSLIKILKINTLTNYLLNPSINFTLIYLNKYKKISINSLNSIKIIHIIIIININMISIN
jgi:hypothetical protein